MSKTIVTCYHLDTLSLNGEGIQSKVLFRKEFRYRWLALLIYGWPVILRFPIGPIWYEIE